MASMIKTEASLPQETAGTHTVNATSVRNLIPHARHISELLKAMAHESRLVILCTLFAGDKSVSELEAVLGLRQPAVSQQLARLRGDGLVKARREGKMIYYSIADEDVRAIIAFLCELYGKKHNCLPVEH